MAQIKHMSDGALITVASDPVWVSGIWECGDQRFTDQSQTLYQPVVSYPIISAGQFYSCFTAFEMLAIKNSTDPLVKEFFARWQVALQAGEPVNPNLVSVQEGLAYLSVTNQLPAVTPAATYILPARIPQILAGTPQ